MVGKSKSFSWETNHNLKQHTATMMILWTSFTKRFSPNYITKPIPLYLKPANHLKECRSHKMTGWIIHNFPQELLSMPENLQESKRNNHQSLFIQRNVTVTLLTIVKKTWLDKLEMIHRRYHIGPKFIRWAGNQEIQSWMTWGFSNKLRKRIQC